MPSNTPPAQNQTGALGGRFSSPPAGGRGREGKFGLGPGGKCVCPKCGKEIIHQRGQPCYKIKCPGCRTPMVRK